MAEGLVMGDPLPLDPSPVALAVIVTLTKRILPGFRR